MTKVAVFYVSCKDDPEQRLQSWIPHMSIIYSQCQHCGAMTGYGQTDKHNHYDFYEIAVKKQKGMSYDDCYAQATELISANKSKYKVSQHSDKSELEGKRLKNKESKI